MQRYPEDIVAMVRRCDAASLSLTQLCYRAPWHMALQPFQEGAVTVAGDAMHAMGPFIGQGGSCSLEDAVVVAWCLATEGARAADGDDRKLAESNERALMSYVKERKGRILWLSLQAFLNEQLRAFLAEPAKRANPQNNRRIRIQNLKNAKSRTLKTPRPVKDCEGPREFLPPNLIVPVFTTEFEVARIRVRRWRAEHSAPAGDLPP